MSQRSQQKQQPQNRVPVPSAPYPPMQFISPPTKSSMSSSPHYSTSYGTNRNSDPTNSGSVTASSARGGEGLIEDDNMLQRQSYSDLPKTSRTAPVHVSQIKMCPQWSDTVACINCIPAIPGVSQQDPNIMRTRKQGPMLLELRYVELANGKNSDSFFATRTMALSRGNPSLGSSVASTCLDVPIVQNYTGQSQASVTAATGLTTGMLAIHTFDDETDEDGLLSSSIEYYHTPRHHRQASAVAWRPNNFNQVAIGLLGSNTSGTQQAPGPRRGGQGSRTGGDREFCCFLWDIETQALSTSKRNIQPMSKLSHNAPVASLAWMLEGQTLAVGGQSRSIQLYDMKISGGNVPPISAHAHNFGVHGIEVCPHRPYLMATFCRAVAEPVKLWDIRRMDSVVSEIKVSGQGNSSQTSSSSPSKSAEQLQVETVKWATLEPGILSVAIGDSVQDYDTNSGSRPVLIRANHVNGGQRIKDIALYRRANPRKSEVTQVQQAEDQSMRLMEALSPRRMLAVLENKTICDLAKHTYAPVAISRRDGRLVHALGSSLWIGSTTFGPAAMENAEISHDEDISATMMRRARCLRVARYSMDTSSNIKMLSEDIPPGESSAEAARFTLLRLWSWIDRVESLCSDAEEMEAENLWPVKGLLDAGMWRLLGMDDEATGEQVLFSDTLSCEVYDSPARRAALASCGWAGKFELINVLAECEALGEYERSAALAVWHGNIGAAVAALQRASGAVRLHLEGKKVSELPLTFASPEYAETLDLIAMCIAGFGGNAVSQSGVWQSACANLLRRDHLSEEKEKNSQIAYLRGLCQFLLNIGRNDCMDQVLENPNLSLCDRAAFACRFLERKELKSYLFKCIQNCQHAGDVEGLVLTGISKDGIKILQSFVDHSADVQTAALVVSRVVLPSDWTIERKICIEWVEAYRGLLNTWQMWQSRAMFDVDRAEVLRRIKSKTADGMAAVGAKTAPYQSRRLQMPVRRQGPRPLDPDVLASVPAQLDARCNYCSSPLGLRRHEGNANQWLSKMRPVLSCCPQCRKPLPRCAVCLLPMGCLNPYMELTRERSRSGPRGSSSLTSPDDLSSLGNLPFAEWFTWCMRCKHGGHAHHLVGWFANHETCPVSGCDCRCQFDGIQKLTRPALSQNVALTPLVNKTLVPGTDD